MDVHEKTEKRLGLRLGLALGRVAYLSSSVTTLVLGFAFCLLVDSLLPPTDVPTFVCLRAAFPVGVSRWLGRKNLLVGVHHVLSNFLLVKLEIVWVRVCCGDDDSSISRSLKGEPL